MIKTTPEQNKALVLEAFDTLFNKRDCDAAKRFWLDSYIQHSAPTGTLAGVARDQGCSTVIEVLLVP
jgi:predicted SnoaL-like aldol condensation-catalyzing enzyme